jgi:hypothetical protein
MEMAALIEASTLGSFVGITVAALERRPAEEIKLWGFRGTAVGFLAGLFSVICCPGSR